MTLIEFARRSGVSTHRCQKDWGGTFGYSAADRPNVRFNGFASKEEALRAWMTDTFGEHAGGAVLELLTPNK